MLIVGAVRWPTLSNVLICNVLVWAPIPTLAELASRMLRTRDFSRIFARNMPANHLPQRVSRGCAM